MKRSLVIILLLILVSPFYAQKPKPFMGCQPEGNGKPTKKKSNWRPLEAEAGFESAKES